MTPHFNEESLIELTRLCKLDCSEEELDNLMKSLDSILDHIDQLNTIDTQGVKPMKQVSEDHVLFLDTDELRDILSPEEFMQNVPSKVGGMVKVPSILKS